MTLPEKQRKKLFFDLNHQNLSRTKFRSINRKLFNDNVSIAKAKKLKGEKTIIHTNPKMETFVFAQKGENVRTLGFVGHTNTKTGVVIASTRVR